MSDRRRHLSVRVDDTLVEALREVASLRNQHADLFEADNLSGVARSALRIGLAVMRLETYQALEEERERRKRAGALPLPEPSLPAGPEPVDEPEDPEHAVDGDLVEGEEEWL